MNSLLMNLKNYNQHLHPSLHDTYPDNHGGIVKGRDNLQSKRLLILHAIGQLNGLVDAGRHDEYLLCEFFGGVQQKDLVGC